MYIAYQGSHSAEIFLLKACTILCKIRSCTILAGSCKYLVEVRQILAGIVQDSCRSPVRFLQDHDRFLQELFKILAGIL